MEQSENDVVNVTNILFRELEPGDITWDGKDIIKKTWSPGEIRPYPRFLAKYIAKKIIDERIIRSKVGIKGVNNKQLRDKYIEQILADPIEVEEIIEEVKEEVKKEVKEEPKKVVKKIAKPKKAKK